MPVEQLFGENGAALYFIASLAIIACTNFSDSQRMFLLYLFSFALTVSGVFRIRTCLILLVCSTFVFLEYLSEDRRKLELVVKPHYKLLDYLYLMFFQYDFPAFLLSMALVFFSSRALRGVLLALSVLCLIRAEQWTVSQPFKIKSFTDLARVFDRRPPYAYRHSDAMRRRFELLCAIEDRSYFSRSRSYSCVSLEYLRWRLGGPLLKTCVLPALCALLSKLRALFLKLAAILPRLWRLMKKLLRLLLRLVTALLKPLRALLRRIGKLLRRAPRLIRRFPGLIRRAPALLRKLPKLPRFLLRRSATLLRRVPDRLRRLAHKLRRAVTALAAQLRRLPRPRLRAPEPPRFFRELRRLLPRVKLDKTGLHISGRGYSTPEMQLLRTIGIARGYEHYKLRRKVYEVLYSKIFFTSFKDYHQANSFLELIHYRDYILWIYTQNVLTVINKTRCKTFSQAFADGEDVEHWSLEGVFVAALGLSFRGATEPVLDLYTGVIDDFGLDREKILRIYKRFPRQKLPSVTPNRVRPREVHPSERSPNKCQPKTPCAR